MKKISKRVLIIGLSCLLGEISLYACSSRIGSATPQDLHHRGLIEVQREDYRDALNYFNRAIESDPNYAEAYVNRGIVYDELNQPQQAIHSYDQAIKINPSLAEAYYNRANSYHRIGEFDRAIEDYSEAIAINSNYVYAYANRAATYRELGKLQEAIKDLQESATLFEAEGDDANRQRTLQEIEKIQNQ